jgi:hypothetical protein
MAMAEVRRSSWENVHRNSQRENGLRVGENIGRVIKGGFNDD